MTKDEALKLALDYLLSKQMGAHIIAAIREALAEPSAEIPQSITCPFCESQHVPGWLHDYNMDRGAYGEQPAQPAQGCEFCSHPQYAGTKCKNCGREQPEQHTEPCGWRMKHNGEWVYSLTKDAWDFIYAVSPAARKAARDSAPAQQQEPVGEVFGYYERGFTEQKTLYGKLHNQDLPVGAKLYTSPPARKPWVGLTDEEISGVLGGDIYDENSGLLTFTRAIEAKLKKKNT